MADVWEQHRSTIYRMYVLQDKSLDDVMRHMKENRGFQRGKTQYGEKLQHWGFVKNSRSSDWKIVHHKIQKKQNIGKSYAVYRKGRRVEPKKLSKESRHNYSSMLDLFNPSTTSPKTPEGFVVCTPFGRDTTPLYINNLPCLQLFEHLRTLACTAPLPTVSAFDTDALRYEHPSRQRLVESQEHVRQHTRVCARSLAKSDAVQWKTCVAGLQTDDIVLDDFASLTSASNLIHRHDTGANKSLAGALPSVELSKILISMVYLASNDLITDRGASSAFELLKKAKCLDLLITLASCNLPAIKAIAKTFLPAAVKSGDTKMVKTLLSTGVGIHSMFSYGSNTLLLIAIRQDDLKMAEFLLEHEADPRRSPGVLHAAVMTGNLQLVKLLYDSGARDEASTWTANNTALQSAASKGQVETIRYLLSRGGDVNAAASRGGETVLQAAASTGIWELVELVLEYHPNDIYAAVVSSINAGQDKIAMALIYQGVDLDRPDGETPLQAASKTGNEGLVRTLVGMSANVNAAPKGGYGMTALQGAARYGNFEVVRFLVENGAYINGDAASKGGYGMTALQEAVRYGNFEVVRFLVENGANINDNPAWVGGKTALQAAAHGGNLQVVQFLLEHGADINADVAEEDGQSVLLGAVHTEDMDLIQFLINKGADVNAESAWCWGHTALEAAVKSGNIEFVRLLLAYDADPNAHDALPLFIEARTASYDIVKLLLEHGADVNRADIDGKTIIEHMVQEKVYSLEIIELLLEHGASKTTALAAIATSGDIDLAEFLLDSEVDVNATQRYGLSAIAEAAGAGDLDMVRLFLGYGANDRSGALFEAVRASQLALVRLLIRTGADVNARPWVCTRWCARSALKEAAFQGNLEITRLLLDAGADVEVAGDTCDSTTGMSSRTTALQYAAIQGHLSVVHELVSRGADVNAPAWSDNDRTALEGAAEHGRLDTVQFLINVGANVHTSRALHFARKEGHDAVVALLMMQ